MNGKNQSGSVIVIIILGALLFFSLIFAAWSFTGRQQYRDDADKLSAQAVQKAEATLQAKLDKEFAEKEKSPFKTYQSSFTLGSIRFDYPKSWSAYVIENDGQPLKGYFHPNVVPSIKDDYSLALRIEITANSYEDQVKAFDNAISEGKMTATSYLPAILKGNPVALPGVRLQGEVDKKQKAIMLIKVRDKTLKISTDSIDYLTDFNTALSTLSFTP